MNCYVDALLNFEGWLAHILGTMAMQSSKRPKITILCYVIICAALGAGLIFMDVESEGRKLWVDQNSESMKNLEYVESVYEAAPRFNQIIITAPTLGDNSLTKTAFDVAFELHEEIAAIRTENGKSIFDLCILSPTGGCAFGGPLQFWNYNKTLYEQQVNNDEDIGNTCALERYPNFVEVGRIDEFAGFSISNDGIATATAFTMSYNLIGEIDGSNDEQLDFEEIWIDIGLKERNGVKIYLEAARSLDDELAETVGADITLLMIAYMLMIVFASLSMGKICSGLYGRSWVAVSSVFMIILASAAAYGLCSYAGVKFTTLTQVLPFILVGIGIDDSYVMIEAFDRTDHKLPVHKRLYESTRNAGLSITVTSMTDFVAFLFTTLTVLPAVQYFGIYAAVSILFIYLAHLTCFAALLTLDTYRVQARRRDMFCCCKVDKKVEDEQHHDKEEEEGSRFAAFLRDRYAPVLLSNGVRIGVLIGFAIIVGIAIWQATLITTDFDTRELTADDSYVRDKQTLSVELWGSTFAGLPTALVFRNTDQSLDETQIEMRRLSDKLFYETETIDQARGRSDWHLEFTEWVQTNPVYNSSLSSNGYLVGSTFAPAVQEFLLLPQYKQFTDNVVFNSNQESIVTSRVFCYHANVGSAEKNIKALEVTEELSEESKIDSFINSEAYIYFDQNRIIDTETIQSLGFSVLAIAIICTVLLVHPISVLLTLTTLAMIFAVLLGLIPIWGLNLNSISAINLIMSIAISVDSIAHVTHTFGLQSPTLSRKQRVTNALHDIGPPVILGLTTTFLGVLPMAFAGSEVFRVFFKMFLSLVVTSFLFGLIFLPVLLSFFGPAIPRKTISRKLSTTSNQDKVEQV